MMCDIDNECVNNLLSVHCHICRSGYTAPHAQIQYPNHTKTVGNVKVMPYLRDTSISFCSLCGYDKLKKLHEGKLVLADGAFNHTPPLTADQQPNTQDVDTVPISK